jgi:apolipoprotein N-acyltransferase
MAFAPDRKQIAITLATIAATAALVYLGNGLKPWWPLMWFAPLPLLLFAMRNSGRASSWRMTFLVSYFAWLLGCLNLFSYFHTTLQMSVWLWFAIFSVESLGIAACVLRFRSLLLRGRPWSALLAFPALWVTAEYLHNILTPDGTGGSFANSQLSFRSFLQLASLTGPWGMTFVLMLFPASIAIAWHLRKPAPKQSMRILSATLGLIALVLTFGIARLAKPNTGPFVKVGLIASETPENSGVASPGPEAERIFRAYATQVQSLAQQGAQIVVIPENLGVIIDQDAPNNNTADQIFQPIADQQNITIVAGVNHKSVDARYNQARIYTPHAVVASYNKHHLLPPFELIFKPGDHRTMLPNAALPNQAGPVGVQICKDMDFTQLSRQYGLAGTALILAPAWDFKVDRFFHGHIAVMRGVESGFSIARASRGGYLTVSDNRGRILAETSANAAPFATLIAEVPTVHDNTLYLMWGDWFAWFAIAIAIITFLPLSRSKAQP